MATNDEAGPSTMKEDSNDQEENLLKETYKLSFEIPPIINGNKDMIDKINYMQDKLIKKGEMDSESQESLMSCYKIAQEKTKEEQKVIQNPLNTIYKIQKYRIEKMKARLQNQKSSSFPKLLQITAKPIPVWFPTNNEEPPPLCGAIEPPPSYIAKSGDLVVVQVIQSKEERWIVAETVAFNNGKYEVEDIDLNGSNRNFILKKKFVKPLPLMKADPFISPKALFPCNSFVLAMYPQTSCFFKALVKAQPKTNRDGYEVLFEDDNQAYTKLMVVQQRFIVPIFGNKNVAT